MIELSKKIGRLNDGVQGQLLLFSALNNITLYMGIIPRNLNNYITLKKMNRYKFTNFVH